MCSWFRKKKAIEHSVCIPEHVKKKEEKNAKTKIPKEKKEKTKEETKNDFVIKRKVSQSVNLFKVTGNYDAGGEIMISGYVESGSIREKMKAESDNYLVKVTEIRIGSKKVDELNFMEEGTIFVKGKNLGNIKYDEILDFKQ